MLRNPNKANQMFNIVHRIILQDRRLSNLKHFAPMKSMRSSRISLVALFIGMTASAFITDPGTAMPPSPEKFVVQTKNLALYFEASRDGLRH